SGTGVILAAARRPTVTLAAAEAAGAVGALALLAALSAGRGARRDEALISATAIVGRGMILVLLAHLSMIAGHWGTLRYTVVMAGFAVLTAGQAVEMLRHGPVSRLTVPDVLAARGARRPAQVPPAGPCVIPPIDVEYPVPSAPWPV